MMIADSNLTGLLLVMFLISMVEPVMQLDWMMMIAHSDFR